MSYKGADQRSDCPRSPNKAYIAFVEDTRIGLLKPKARL